MTTLPSTSAAPAESTASTSEWWRQATVYQIYPRSFADGNGDGIGDLPGILSRVDYLAELGIDAVWMSPFYPSELADGGYDVADYRNVDPRLGTLADFDALVSALHARDIRVVVDIVPNHTSDQHVWFQEALAAGRGSAERERYIFREGSGAEGSEPPTDWTAAFGGSTWERVDDGQWYLHSFAIEQPDLNWNHPEVREDFLHTLRFWSDRGVDGFRIDVAHMLTKDLTEPLPSAVELAALPIDGTHPLLDRDDVHEVYAQWREVFNSYDPPRTAVAEAWVASDRVPKYASPESLGQSFNFDLLRADFDAAQFREIVTHNIALAAESGSSSTWVLSNHDVFRHPTRYGLSMVETEGDVPQRHGGGWLESGADESKIDRVGGIRRARAASMFLLGLPGSAYLYQGEELGLHEVSEIAPEDRQDPTFFRTNQEQYGRDGCRVPLPWTREGASFGFGTGGAHLPQPTWFTASSVEAEESDASSTLSLYRRALSLRHELQSEEQLEWIETGRDDVLRFRRPGGWEVITNFGVTPYPIDDARVALSSTGAPDGSDAVAGEVAGESTVWITAP